MLGKHTVSFGASYTYTQLNTIDKRTGTGTVATDDFSQMVQGYVTPGSSATGFYVSSFLQGNASRYYRANQLGTYVQDKCQITPTLSLTAGVRYDWDGGLTEKYGRIFNFDSQASISYNAGSDTDRRTPGLIIAGNNANGTKGVSHTTLTGRQWGIAPRVGAAWQPGIFHNKVVVRAGGGMYYDRGELFSYFSPGYAIGTVTGGPFGVNQQLPFVNASSCPQLAVLYEGYIPTCGGDGGSDPAGRIADAATATLRIPMAPRFNTPPPNNPKASDLSNYLPNARRRASANQTASPSRWASTTAPTSCPTPINYTLDIQWQPRNDLAIEAWLRGQPGPPPGHSGAIQPAGHRFALQPRARRRRLPAELQLRLQRRRTRSARPTAPPYLANYEGGNVDLRVPYIGYAAESIAYKAAGVDAYNALQAHVEKRMSHGIQVGASYTYSHALDEQSGLGLFYNGNNPLNLRSGYGSADFDRTHVINFNYVFRVPDFATRALAGGQARRRVVAGRPDGAAERPALQRHRLLRRHRQHLLLHRRRHHQPHRAAGQRLHGQDRHDRALRRMVPGDRQAGSESRLLHPSAAPGGWSWRRHSHLRSIRDRIHHRPAQHLPPGLPETRRCLAGEGDQLQ